MPLPYFHSVKQKRWRRRTLWPIRPNKTTKHWRSWLWRFGLVAVLAGGVVMVGLFAWASRDLPTPEGIAHRIVPQSTKIYDRTGKIVLYDMHGEERRTAVEFKDIPPKLIQATLTAEDRNFYNHGGFQLSSMARALLVDIIKGGKVQGGSTITQQFIKNAIVGQEKSVLRKIKELILAYQIEKKFSKDEILKLYFNEIPYGSNAYGAEAAAQTFFGKSAKDLSLAECTLLAALPKATTYYSPWGTHRDQLLGRQHYILDGMVEQGYITKAEAESAKAVPLKFLPRREAITAPHFIFYVRELLAEKYGDLVVEQGGLKVTTTLDAKLQQYAEEAITQSVKKNSGYKASNASLVAIDVPTGQILAMVGSRDYFAEPEPAGCTPGLNCQLDPQNNVAILARQPGSSFKPVVYSEAFSQGFTPETILFDVVTTFKTDTKDYTPHDYDDKERGPVSLRQALAGSLNIPAVKLLYLSGVDKVLGLAKKLGYTTLGERSRFGLSLVLGGGEVKLLEHTNVYATFAREGTNKPTTALLKVEDTTGAMLDEFKDAPGERVLETQPVRQLTSILSDNQARSYIFGSSNPLTLSDRPVAAKTGTTNDYRDAWTLGYTPKLAAGVWVGNSNNAAMKRGADGSVVAAPIWRAFMQRATANTPINQFTPPETRAANKPILNGELGGETVAIDLASGKRATELTPPSYRFEKTFRQYHTILRYLKPGDPQGPIPAAPEQDPQYATWEEAIRTWAQKLSYTDESPPTEFDDLHTEANRPQINITSPTTGETITQNPIPLRVDARAPRGIRRVKYFLDDSLIGEVSPSPFGLLFPVTTDWVNGFHTLKAIAYDDIDNSQEISTTFNILVTPLLSAFNISITSPVPNQEIKLAEFPLAVRGTVTHPEQLKQIDLYIKPDKGPSQWLGVITSPSTNVALVFPQVEPGRYTLSFTTTDLVGEVKAGPGINITTLP